jgi:hypothetical protein
VQVQREVLVGQRHAVERRGIWRQVNRVLYHHSGQYSTCGGVVQDTGMWALLAAPNGGKSPYGRMSSASIQNRHSRATKRN